MGLLAPAVAVPGPRATPVRGMVGKGALWRAARMRVEERFRAREWLLLEGEPGTGELTLARAIHLAHTPAGHLRVLDIPGPAAPAASAFVGPAVAERWLAEVRDELSGSGTVIVRHLTPFLITRLAGRPGGPRCSPEAMRMLLRHRWPGNVSQLADVLRRIVAHRRTGTITLADLPAEVQTATRRTLAPLASIECDPTLIN